jgi:seryl-tRNA synthetase
MLFRYGGLLYIRSSFRYWNKPTHRSCFSDDIKRRIHVDFKKIIQDIERLKENARKRGAQVDLDNILQLYNKKCELECRLNELRCEKNKLSKISLPTAETLYRGKQLKEAIALIEADYAQTEATLIEEILYCPNETHPETPVGDASSSRLIETIHSCPTYTFIPKDHLELAKMHDLIDFERAAQVTGSQFYYLRNEAAQMELALIHHAMNMAIKEGLIPVMVPDMIRLSVMDACGYRSRGDATQIYSLASPHAGFCLAGTAEIPLAGMYMNDIIPRDKLPLYMTAFSHCFRAEAGGRGKETKGLYRVHQFSKVELFAITTEDQSDKAFQKIINTQKSIVTSLELYARLVEMSTEELGLSAYRKIDIEAWMPGRGIFGEISSASHCTDFQSRRLNIRYKNENGESQYVHTLN